MIDMSRIDKNEHRTIVYSQRGRVVVYNSTRHKESALDRHLAQISIEDRDGYYTDCLNLTDEAIDSLIEALNDAKTKLNN